MQRQEAKTLKDVLMAYIQSEGLAEGLIRMRIFSAWDDVVGLNIAKNTYNKFYKDGVLFCKIQSSVVRSQLMMIKDDLIASINKQLGKEYVKEIVLK